MHSLSLTIHPDDKCCFRIQLYDNSKQGNSESIMNYVSLFVHSTSWRLLVMDYMPAYTHTPRLHRRWSFGRFETTKSWSNKIPGCLCTRISQRNANSSRVSVWLGRKETTRNSWNSWHSWSFLPRNWRTGKRHTPWTFPYLDKEFRSDAQHALQWRWGSENWR